MTNETQLAVSEQVAVHLRSRILTGEMTKAAALEEMGRNYYPEDLRHEDIDLIARKLKLRPDERTMLTAPTVHSHHAYPNQQRLTRFLIAARNRLGLKR